MIENRQNPIFLVFALAGLLGKAFSDFFLPLYPVSGYDFSSPRKLPLDFSHSKGLKWGDSPLAGEPIRLET